MIGSSAVDTLLLSDAQAILSKSESDGCTLNESTLQGFQFMDLHIEDQNDGSFHGSNPIREKVLYMVLFWSRSVILNVWAGL